MSCLVDQSSHPSIVICDEAVVEEVAQQFAAEGFPFRLEKPIKSFAELRWIAKQDFRFSWLN